MTSKLTREQTQQIIDAADAVISALAGTNDEVHKDDTDKMIRLWDDLNDRYAPPEVVRELARMALAAMEIEPQPDDQLANLLWHAQEAVCHSDPNYYCEFQRLAVPGVIAGIIRELQERRKADSEPVAWTDEAELRDVDRGGCGYLFTVNPVTPHADERRIILLYRHAQQPAAVVLEEMTADGIIDMHECGYVEGWNACRAAMLQAGNCWENSNSSTNNCREIAETSTNRSREHFISLCNEFWNWSEMDLVCADDRGYELRMEWDGKVFNHPVTQALWRMYQAAPTGIPIISDRWIPVSERMPEMGEQQCYVLAADFKNHYWPNIPNIQVGVYGDWFDDGNPTWDDGDGEDLNLKEVTHWMPLPAAPQDWSSHYIPVNRGDAVEYPAKREVK